MGNRVEKAHIPTVRTVKLLATATNIQKWNVKTDSPAWASQLKTSMENIDLCSIRYKNE
jgi:hypothetical protein